MALYDIKNLLSTNTYPGRGIIIGKSADGKNAMIAYFIMGRSENSRNRIFERFDDRDYNKRRSDRYNIRLYKGKRRGWLCLCQGIAHPRV